MFLASNTSTFRDIAFAVQKISKRAITFSFFLSLDTALPPREDYVQVDCVLKPRYKKCTEKEKDKDDSVKKNVQGELKEG